MSSYSIYVSKERLIKMIQKMPDDAQFEMTQEQLFIPGDESEMTYVTIDTPDEMNEEFNKETERRLNAFLDSREDCSGSCDDCEFCSGSSSHEGHTCSEE